MPSLTEFNLDGKTALVTGAGRGIGRGVVIALAEAGADVALNARTEQSAGALAREVEARGRRGLSLPGDAMDPEFVAEMVQTTVNELGGIDILVSALGDSIRGTVAQLPGGAGPEPFSDEQWKFGMDVNLNGTYLLARHAGPHMLERGSGKVIFISSFGGVRAAAGNSVYTAAKAGLNNFTQALALEWAPYNVQVNAISPGQYPDPWPQTLEEFKQDPRKNEANPLGRTGHPREVGLVSVMLASAAGDYITGQIIGVDGGSTLGTGRR